MHHNHYRFSISWQGFFPKVVAVRLKSAAALVSGADARTRMISAISITEDINHFQAGLYLWGRPEKPSAQNREKLTPPCPCGTP